MTIATGQTITASDLNTRQGANRAGLTAAAANRKRTLVVNKHVESMTSAAAKALEATVTFTPDDDYELRALGIVARKVNAGGGITLTLALTAADGDDDYVLEHTLTLTASVSGSGAEDVARTAYDDTAGTRVMLHKGVRYKLALTSDSATSVDQAAFCLVARLWRRAR